MTLDSHYFKYKKQLNSRGLYGAVKIAMGVTSGLSDDADFSVPIVVNEADLKTTTGYDKNWAKSAESALDYLLNSYLKVESKLIRIKEVHGIPVDSLPVHFGIAMIIGIFEIMDSPLDEKDLKQLDQFALEQRDPDAIPDYTLLQLNKPKLDTAS